MELLNWYKLVSFINLIRGEEPGERDPGETAVQLGAAAAGAMAPRYPYDPKTRVNDFLRAPEGVPTPPSAPDNAPDRRLQPKNGPAPTPAPSPESGASGTASPQQATGIADILNSEVFSLSSNPGASKTIFLDFDGYDTSATAWNNQGADSIASIPVFSLDATVSTAFSQAELDAIKEIYLRVAADYAPFNVNVTTQTPTADKITRSGSGDNIYGTVAAIGNVGSQWSGAGGIAYVGIFNSTSDYNKPALVFPSRLSNGAKYIAEATSHEVGHNLNLSHDGVTGTNASDYYTGGGSSPGWAPIMGVGYYEPLVTFSKGDYNNASQTQNDFMQILGEGVGRYLEATINDSTATAQALTIDSTGFGSSYGMIQLMSDDGNAAVDADFYSFVAGASGTATVSVNNALIYSKDGGSTYVGTDLPSGYGNLHLDAQILDSTGAVLADWNSDAVLDVSTLSASVTAGQTYFVKVMPNATLTDANIGERTWGSLGNYALRINTPPGDPGNNPDDYSATISTAGQVVLGASASGNLEAVGDHDWFKVTLAANTTYTFRQNQAGGTLSNPALALMNSSATVLASNDNAPSGGNDSIITYRPSTSGDYYLNAGATGDSLTGTYSVFANADDYAESTATTGTIARGKTISGNLQYSSDNDWFKVSLKRGITYTFKQNSTTLADPLLTLRSSTGAVITPAGSSNTLISFTAPSSGNYFLDAGSVGDTGLGTYTVSFA